MQTDKKKIWLRILKNTTKELSKWKKIYFHKYIKLKKIRKIDRDFYEIVTDWQGQPKRLDTLK
jgi:hypothetical protein